MTTYIDAKHVAAELKRRLKTAFPGVKFSVVRGRGTGSTGIDVTWTDGPTDGDVAEISNPMQGSRWNGYDERYEDLDNTVTVTIDGKRVTGRPVVDSIHLRQEVSDEVKAEALALWHAANGEDASTQGQNGGFNVEGEFIAGSWGVNQVLSIALRVILPRRWAAAHPPAAAQAPAAVPAATTPAPASTDGVRVQHTDTEGITATGTTRGDGAAPVLKAQGFKWHRANAYWFLPGTRAEAGAERLPAVLEALRAEGLTLSADVEPAPAEEPPAVEPAPVEVEEAPAAEEPTVEEPEFFYCGADLGRQTFPYTCHLEIGHEGRCTPGAAFEEPAPVEDQPDPAIPPAGMEAGAHRVTNTGQGEPHGAGTAYLFRCHQCQTLAPLVEFDSLKCTPQAEQAEALHRAGRLLDDVILRDAPAYVFTYALSTDEFPCTRAEAVDRVARLLILGATHRWYAGEMRLFHNDYQVATLRHAPDPVEVEPTPVKEAPAPEVADKAPTEKPRPGLDAGAHRIAITREAIGAPGTEHVFRCWVCKQRAPLTGFETLPCTDEAEGAHLLEVAARLLDDVGLRDVDVFHVIGGPGDWAPLQTRAEATRFLAARLQSGVTHHWCEGELRLARGGETAGFIKPAPAPLPCARTAPQAYRGVPVPAHVAGAWSEQSTGAAWREGVDAALTFAALARAAD
ncbi:LPD29 domain-containing protein [Streptomyces sp. H27-H5]|uniref:LPD29 domain-containing protein n=1 Tax=Streptomyces sp. H27-H5 TaxID=2996460 RepID=UPI00226F3369|nr:LPD29 domain-containing protein [Streptomyces sp. H27-H5]MCY0957706.1 hypothetical protein [Streptomyces sp. H27-H5]